MHLRNLALAGAALSLAVSPAIAEASIERASAPVEDGSKVAGGAGIVIAVLAAAAIISSIVIIADNEDDLPASP